MVNVWEALWGQEVMILPLGPGEPDSRGNISDSWEGRRMMKEPGVPASEDLPLLPCQDSSHSQSHWGLATFLTVSPVPPLRDFVCLGCSVLGVIGAMPPPTQELHPSPLPPAL